MAVTVNVVLGPGIVVETQRYSLHPKVVLQAVVVANDNDVEVVETPVRVDNNETVVVWQVVSGVQVETGCNCSVTVISAGLVPEGHDGHGTTVPSA